jgi:hypothetical protein
VFRRVKLRNYKARASVCGRPIDSILSRIDLRLAQGASKLEPRQTAKLNFTWSPSTLPALKLGAAVQYQSHVYRDTITNSGVDARVTQAAMRCLTLWAAMILPGGSS